MSFEERLGVDLKLLTNLGFQNDRDRGRDLHAVAREVTGLLDLETLSGVNNIAQALLHRFLTRQGEMAILGHPDYGSRLHELIGEPNTQGNRDRAKLFALKALNSERRVAEVLTANVTTRPDDPGAVDIALELKILDRDDPLNLVVPFSFDEAVSP